MDILLQRFSFGLLLFVCFMREAGAGPIQTAEELAHAVRNSPENSTIEVGPGRFELKEQLELKTGMVLHGAGMDRTTITHAPGWKPSTKSLPDPEMKLKGLDTEAYLIRLKDKASNITIS
ncbi:MAG: hypothetical protein AAF492_32355, partial [Verrucomicrobiota bacterium]